MGQAASDAGASTQTQLRTIFPNLTSTQTWTVEGMTMLPGIGDYPKKTEVTYLTDAQTVLTFAQQNGMNFLSIWAIQRDNGGWQRQPARKTWPRVERDTLDCA